MSHFQNLIPYPRLLQELSGSVTFSGQVILQTTGLSRIEGETFAHLAALVLGDWLNTGTTGGLPANALRIDVHQEPGYAPSELSGVPAPLREEAYELVVNESIRLTAAHFRGLQRGIQTIKQLLEDATGVLPACRIVDWPRLAHRGLHYDFAREMEYRPEHVKSIIARLAYLKMNTFHLYLEAAFAYPSAPHIAHPCPMTPDDARELKEYAGLFGVSLVPQIATLGHMEKILHGPYEALRETPSSHENLCPTHPDSRPFIAGLIRDVADAFTPEFIHLGYDESHSGICERCQQHGTPGEILPEYLNWMNEQVKSHGARSMIYADKFLSAQQFPRADATNGGTPAEAQSALDGVSRDIVLTDWHYTAPYGQTVGALVQQGFDVHIVTDVGNYWHDSIPLARGHHWIADTIENAVDEGASGAFNCTWELYRGAWFENFWFFHGLATERQWTDAPHDFVSFGLRFSSRFWGIGKDYYSDMAALLESLPVRRRGLFLDCSVLADGGMAGARYDYIQLAGYLDRQLQTFRSEARRNVDTLQMLDMPALVLRYLGTRVLHQILARAALDAGEPQKAHEIMEGIREVALRIQHKLAEGYRMYGGGASDRTRLQAHLAELDKALAAGDLRESVTLTGWSASSLQPAQPVAAAVLPPALQWTPVPSSPEMQGPDVRDLHRGEDGLLFLRAMVRLPHAFAGRLLFGSDGPVKVWVNTLNVACIPDATNPATPDEYTANVAWLAGENEILFALATNHGKAWGLGARTAPARD